MKKLFLGLLTIAIIILLSWLKVERSFLPRRSTRDYWSLSPLPFLKKLEGYIYGARTSLYLKPATWKWFLKKSVDSESADTYHGKVLTVAGAAKVISVKGPVKLTNLEHVIPYPVARDIIFKSGTQHIAVLRCPCREQKKDACEPREVCLVIGQPFSSFVVEHQPDKARMISANEALEIIKAEERRGHIHTAWFKDVMHNRLYAICNCCKCCCLGMQSFLRGVPRLAHSGYRPLVDRDICTGCSECENVCQFSAINVDHSHMAMVNEASCMGCGLCVSHCLAGAITLEPTNDNGLPLAIDLLLSDHTAI